MQAKIKLSGKKMLATVAKLKSQKKNKITMLIKFLRTTHVVLPERQVRLRVATTMPNL